jgi:2-polyprenyl-3-methyl-5-hydroxy-6-metoxy-1,4-benzoquinol methylase
MLSTLLDNHLKVDITRLRRSNFLEAQRTYESAMIEKINSRHGWKEVKSCPLCGSKKSVEEFSKCGIPLVKCEECDVRFNRRMPADLNDVYQDPGYLVYTKESTEEHYSYRRERFGRERLRLLARHCGELSGKRLLDVGCGDGYFLSVAKESGLDCVGAEFSEKLRRFTEEKVKVPVYANRLSEFPDRGFDVITIFDVIEHIETPVPFLREAADLLNGGGHILVYTPNFDSFSVRVMKEYSSIVDPKEHLALYTSRSLRYLGEQVGLRVVHTETRGLDIHSILSYHQYLGKPANDFLLEWLDELQAIIDASGAADYIRVLYQKAD